MTTENIKFTGGRELAKMLKEMGDPTLVRRYVSAEQRKAAKDIILPEIVKQAPEQSGRLRQFIGVGAQRRRNYVRTVLGLVRLSKAMMAKGLNYDAYYGRFVELGTRYQKPQHFMLNAFYSKREPFLAAYIPALKARVIKEAEKHKNRSA